MSARRQADQDAGSSAGAAFHAPRRKGDDNMLTNSSVAYQGDLVVLAVPNGAVFSLTISDTPNPGFIAFRPPPAAVDMRTEVIECNLRRHRQAEESRIRFLAAPRRPYALRWRSESCRSAE
jgi:hypothetical protein